MTTVPPFPSGNFVATLDYTLKKVIKTVKKITGQIKINVIFGKKKHCIKLDMPIFFLKFIRHSHQECNNIILGFNKLWT